MEIRLQNVVKRFGDKEVLRNLTFSVQDGQFVALLGPSGCGKTTLLNLLAGFLELDGGTVTVGDTVWSRPGFSMPPEHRNVGMVFQDFALWPHMTVFDNIAFGLKLRKLSAAGIQTRVHQVLETVHMSGYAKSYPHELSGGQKQRIAIARALAPQPSVLLMDEPLSSLDAKLREQMRWDLLDIIRRAGITTIYVTHDQSEALSMADNIVLLNEGNLEQEGTPAELYNHPKSPFAASFMGAANLLKGQVDSVKSDKVLIDCQGHMIYATGQGKVGETKVLCIRPAEIEMTAIGASTEGKSGAWLTASSQATLPRRSTMSGTIVQRAFHGSNWRYRVELVGSPKMIVEAWDDGQWQLGAEVVLTVHPEKCLVLQNTLRAEAPIFS